MKIKVIILSFLITTFLSLNFVIPQLIQENLQVYLGDVQKILITYGLELRFESVSLSYIPLKIKVDKLSVAVSEGDDVFSTQKVEFSNWNFSELVNIIKGEMSISDLSKLKVAMQQLEINDNYLSPNVKSGLSALGYKKLLVNVVSDYQYDSVAKEFDLNEFSIEGFNMGKVNLKMQLSDFVFPSSFEVNELTGFNQSSVKFFSVEYTEDSLVKNLKILADKNNVLLDKYLAYAKKVEGNRDPANIEESEITLSLQKFVNDPKSMRLAMSPEKQIPFKDISLMMMLSPGKLIESLQPTLVINGSEVRILPHH